MGPKMQKVQIFKKKVQQTFLKFYVIQIYLEVFWYKLDMFRIALCPCFVFRDTFSVRIGRSLLFNTCFYIKLLQFFFVRIATCREQGLDFGIIAKCIYCEKCKYMSFMNNTFCCHLFSLDEVLEGISKSNSAKNQINRRIQVTQ